MGRPTVWPQGAADRGETELRIINFKAILHCFITAPVLVQAVVYVSTPKMYYYTDIVLLSSLIELSQKYAFFSEIHETYLHR